MKKQIILIILVLIQIALSNLLGPTYIFPKKANNKRNVTNILSTAPQAKNLSKEQLIETLSDKKTLDSNIKKQGSQTNSNVQPEQQANKNNPRLLVISENQTDNNSKSTPTVITHPVSPSSAPEFKPALTQQILDYVYEPSRIRDKSKIYTSITKETYYSISFDLVIAGSGKIDPTAKITAIVQGNQNSTNINVVSGVSKQVVPFYGTVGMNEISVLLKVDGKCKGFIYALLYNIQVVQVK